MTPNEIATFVVETRHESISQEVLIRAKTAVADTLAATLAGTASELATPLLRYVAGSAQPGQHPIIGTGIRTSAELAALANGTLAHALDFDDTVPSMPGHPGSVVLPSLLVGLLRESVSGSDLLGAYAVGYEVATKLGRALGSGHYRRGWHATSTAGIFGATAALSNLYRFDVSSTAQALGIAASMSSGLKVNFGTMTKPLHSGWAAHAGVTAVGLVRAGFTGHDDAVTGPNGFIDVYGVGDSELSPLSHLGDPFTLVTPGIAFKKYACAYAMHRGIDAIETLRTTHQLSLELVQRVTARVPPGSLAPLPYHHPTTGLEAKFSMEYALAAGIVDGDFGPEAFTDEAVSRPAIQKALAKTTAVEDPTCCPDDPDGLTASAGTRGFVEVTIELKDGRLLVERVRVPPGSPERPLTQAELKSKFMTCSKIGGLPEEEARELLELVTNLDEVEDAHELLARLGRVP